MLRFIIIYINFTLTVIYGKQYPLCLDDCLCDREDAVIRCDHGTRTKVTIPEYPIYGYKFIAITCNDVRQLPDEAILKAAFPDLQGVDVQGNRDFDCDSLSYKEIPVLSDCGSETVTDCKVNEECDWKCSTLSKLKELWAHFTELLSRKYHEYGGEQLGETIKQKYYEIGGDQMVEKVGGWFSDAFAKLKNLTNDE
ncbi:unnamed protein product, partial [Mesorhabditis belari]|uniref:Uncharacterized protein n=1 Tax=Mesorhabditis belari TaxID=2138241 RepID=A0AAF3FRW8_9BILA